MLSLHTALKAFCINLRVIYKKLIDKHLKLKSCMNNRRNFHLGIAIAAILVSGLVSCKDDEIKVTDVKLDKTMLTLGQDMKETLVASVQPDNATDKTVTWKSSDDKVATVADGLVTGKSEGTATITVTTKDGSKTATCKITVKKPHAAEPEMVIVRGGTFTMGCTDEDCDSLNRDVPAHKVTLSSFKIAKYEVTQKQWKEVMGNSNNPSKFKGDNLPVDNVSWDDVQNFITRLNEATGKKYRLPTEAEWEYAARGGNQSKNYAFSGSDILKIGDVAWYQNTSSGKTHAVGTKAPNELDIYDMSGNVAEWCNDWYAPYTADSQTNPVGPATGTYRVFRGGGWGDTKDCRVASRSGDKPTYRSNDCGFRLVHPE